MSHSLFVELLSYAELLFCAVVLLSMVRSDATRKFIFLTSLLSLKLISGVTCMTLINFSSKGIERHLAYQMYFYVYWLSYALEAILSLLVISSIFNLAMVPRKGLQTLGSVVYPA